MGFFCSHRAGFSWLHQYGVFSRAKTPVTQCLLYKAKLAIPIIPVSDWNWVKQNVSEEITKTCPVFFQLKKIALAQRDNFSCFPFLTQSEWPHKLLMAEGSRTQDLLRGCLFYQCPIECKLHTEEQFLP